jgi:hypothetical protein
MSRTLRGIVLLAALASPGCLGEVVLADPPRPATDEDVGPARLDAALDEGTDAGRDARADATAPLDADAPDGGGLAYVILGPGTPTATCTGALTPRGSDDTFTVRATVDLVRGYGTWWPGPEGRLPELTGTFAVDNFAREPLVFSTADTITPDRLICQVDARDRVSLPDALVVVGTSLIVERPNITPQSLPLRLRYIVENTAEAPFGRCVVDVALVTRAYP